MIMLFNQLLDMSHLSGGWIILAKEKCSQTGMLTNVCTKLERNKLFMHMGHFWDVLFQLIKHEPNTLHVEFIFLFSVLRNKIKLVFGARASFQKPVGLLICGVKGVRNNCAQLG